MKSTSIGPVGREGRGSIAVWGTSAMVVVILCLLVASCGGTSSGTTGPTPTTVGTSNAGAGGAQVAIKGFTFDPATVTIKAGESVTWTNQDSVGHTVVGDGGEFTSGNLATGDTFSFTFDTAGTYAYHCGIHPSMKATVIVE